MTYLWVGYALTWLAVVWFAWRLERRAAEASSRLDRAEGAGGGGRTGSPGPGRLGQGTLEGERPSGGPGGEPSGSAGSN